MTFANLSTLDSNHVKLSLRLVKLSLRLVKFSLRLLEESPDKT
jgi:hypothetical protein